MIDALAKRNETGTESENGGGVNMIYRQEDVEREAMLRVAQSMVAAAHTAPKGRGFDNIVSAIVDGDEKDKLAAAMREIHVETGSEGPFQRDADNVDGSDYVVLIGVKHKPGGMNCGNCGFDTCKEAIQTGARCAFNISDLGIAVGSAVSLAADNRIDNRVLYTAGRAAVKLGLLGDEVKLVYGIPLSVTSKSIYFDRYDPHAGRK